MIFRRLYSTLLLILAFGITGYSQEAMNFQTVVSTALQHNFDLLIARNNTAIAHNNNTAGNAGMLPSIAITGQQQFSVQNSKQKFITGDETSRNSAQSSSLALGVQLNWTIFDGFNMFATKNKLEDMEMSAQLDERAQVEQLMATVYTYYYQIIQEQALLKAERQSLNISEQRYELQSKMYDLGSGSEIEKSQAAIDRNADSSSVINERYTIRNLKNQLNVLMGRDVRADFIVNDTIVVDSALNFNVLEQQLEQQNTQLLLARSKAAEAQESIKQAQSSNYPQIGVFGGYDFNKSKSQSGFLSSNRALGPTAGITLSWNIFNGFNTERQVHNSQLMADNANQQVNQIMLDQQQLLSSTYERYKGALERLSLESQNYKDQQSVTHVALRQYELGQINDLTFRQYQFSSLQAFNRLLTAQYDAKIAEINLQLLTGRLKVK